MRIRKAVPDEAAKLTSLARLAKASWGYPDSWLREWESELSISRDYILENLVFVLEEDREVVGVVGLEIGEEGPEIGHLWVSPHTQGRGVGRALVEEAKDVARELGWVALRVVSDPFAEPFYERMGGVRIGEVPAPVAGTARTLPVLSIEVDAEDAGDTPS